MHKETLEINGSPMKSQNPIPNFFWLRPCILMSLHHSDSPLALVLFFYRFLLLHLQPHPSVRPLPPPCSLLPPTPPIPLTHPLLLFLSNFLPALTRPPFPSCVSLLHFRWPPPAPNKA